jgi:uncharacterized protein
MMNKFSQQGKCSPHCIARWLLIIGGLNWGLIGLAQWNVVEMLFGSWSWLVQIIYILVGFSAVLMIIEDGCKVCKK